MPEKRPPKPYDTFPLFPHSKGYWCKKIKKIQLGFGSWAWPNRNEYEKSWKAALKRYQKHQEDLARGEAVLNSDGQLNLDLLVDAFLTFKHDQADRKEISSRMFYEYVLALRHFRNALGGELTIASLEQAPGLISTYCAEVDARLGWHAFNKQMTLLRAMFRWAADPLGGNMLSVPFRMLGLFKKKGEKALRKAKRLKTADHGGEYVPAGELRCLLTGAGITLRAQLLLGYFCAYGNTDCSDLPINAINRRPASELSIPAGWGLIHFPRPKTEVDRAAVVPPIVLKAIDDVLARRHSPLMKEWSSRLFITRFGYPFVRDRVWRDSEGIIDRPVHIDSVGMIYSKLRLRVFSCPEHHGWELDATGSECLTCRKPFAPVRKMGFYALRHTAITDASGCADVDVLSRFQGHIMPGMRRFYVEQIEAHKLVAIAQCLMRKLFGPAALAEALVPSQNEVNALAVDPGASCAPGPVSVAKSA